MKSLGYQSVHSSENSNSQLLYATVKHTTKKEVVGCPREVRGEYVGALTAGAHFLCGQNFEQADKISVSASWALHFERPGIVANHRHESPLVDNQKFHFCRSAPVSPFIRSPSASALFYKPLLRSHSWWRPCRSPRCKKASICGEFPHAR
jgi:hypothetical protein